MLNSVRWESSTHLVKEGRWWVPKVFVTGRYSLRGGDLKGENNDNDSADNKNDDNGGSPVHV